MGDLHPIDERSGNYVIIVVIHQSYLALKITNILFKALPRPHLDGQEVIDVLP